MNYNNWSLKPNILFIVLDGIQSNKFHGSGKTSITPNIDLLIEKMANADYNKLYEMILYCILSWQSILNCTGFN